MYFRGIILHFESGRSKKFYQMTFFAFTFATIIFMKIKQRGHIMHKFRISNKECRKGTPLFGVRETILACYLGTISLRCLSGIVPAKPYQVPLNSTYFNQMQFTRRTF